MRRVSDPVDGAVPAAARRPVERIRPGGHQREGQGVAGDVLQRVVQRGVPLLWVQPTERGGRGPGGAGQAGALRWQLAALPRARRARRARGRALVTESTFAPAARSFFTTASCLPLSSTGCESPDPIDPRRFSIASCRRFGDCANFKELDCIQSPAVGREPAVTGEQAILRRKREPLRRVPRGVP